MIKKQTYTTVMRKREFFLIFCAIISINNKHQRWCHRTAQSLTINEYKVYIVYNLVLLDTIDKAVCNFIVHCLLKVKNKE